MTEASEPDGSRRPQVLLSLTNDSIKLVAALHGLRQSGELDLVTSISVAQVCYSYAGVRHGLTLLNSWLSSTARTRTSTSAL